MLDPAAYAAHVHPTPLTGALTHGADYTRFDFGSKSRCVGGIAAHIDHRTLIVLEPGGCDGSSLSGKQRLVDPAFRAVRIADTTPVVIFLDDLDGQSRLHEKP